MSYSLMSVPKYCLTIGVTFLTASFAMTPNFPVATISFSLPQGPTAASIGSMIPENEPPLPITASPFTLPMCFPVVIIISYSLFLSMNLSAICCSRVFAIFLAAMRCSFITSLDFFSTAMSPAALISPPSSLSLSVRCPFLFASLFASSITAMTASFEKWGIFLSLITSCATNLAIFSLFSIVSGIVSFMNIS